MKQIHEYQSANQEMRVQMLRRQMPVLEGRKEEIQGQSEKKGNGRQGNEEINGGYK